MTGCSSSSQVMGVARAAFGRPRLGRSLRAGAVAVTHLLLDAPQQRGVLLDEVGGEVPGRLALCGGVGLRSPARLAVEQRTALVLEQGDSLVAVPRIISDTAA